ncbi:MAG TPA: LLM class F420-dependent oxidoreductase [Pseudonocardia sp.]|jgi:probable F420-dependent oxidoreductase|nr:LLM class F420-dependent oxidoreductase [Pseudonocardia sp.]
MHVGVSHIRHGNDLAEVGKRAEDLGFESYWLPDHTVLPVHKEAAYPGTPAGEEEPDYLWQFVDPLIGLSHVAAVTSTIKLGTGVCLVPERNPIVLASQVASLDHLSGGRVLFGIGGGWCREECEILGGDFDHRWSQIKEYVAAAKVLWTEDPSEYHGRYVDFPAVRAFPKPVQRPHPPVLMGSVDNPRALRRVVEWGDGWVPLVQGVDEFAAGATRIRQLAEECGRDPESIDLSVFGLSGQWMTKESYEAFEQAGCNRLILFLDALTTEENLAHLEALAAEFSLDQHKID